MMCQAQNNFSTVRGLCLAIVMYKNITMNVVQKNDQRLAVVERKLCVTQASEFVWWQECTKPVTCNYNTISDGDIGQDFSGGGSDILPSDVSDHA